MRRSNRFVAAAAVAFAFTASISGQAQAPVAPRGIDPANMDTSCAACDDFYRFANGGWLDKNPIPEWRSSWSSYEEVNNRTNVNLKAILEEAAGVAARGDTASTQGKLGLFYATCMDTGRAAAEGTAPIQPMLDRISAIADRDGLQEEITRLHASGVDVVFSFFPQLDPKNSRVYIGGLAQSGTSLPDVGDYYGDTPASREKLERLRTHVAKMTALTGLSPEAAQAEADRVVALETALARASMTRLQMRDPQATTNRISAAALPSVTPHWNWNRYLPAIGVNGATIINLATPDYMRAADKMLAERPLDEWKAYLRWRLIEDSARWLSPALADAHFAFSSSFSGAKVQQPRWEQCMGMSNELMGEALGKFYMERTFTPQSRARGTAMIANLKSVLRERLGRLEWMSSATRREAIAKLDAMKTYVGGPTKWTDYNALSFDKGSSVDLFAKASAFTMREWNARIGHPVDFDRWEQLPQRASGMYDGLRNRLVYPAAKFQPPFFDPLADDAVNYGALGSTIGHEIGHGFDDEGRQFDAAGNLRDWWTPEDAKRFIERADRFAGQYDQFQVNGEPVNGKLTLGENLADLGGLTISYYALQKALKGKPRTKISGFTPEQRFFISWAQNWRNNTRPQRASVLLKTDPHAPAKFRVLGPLSNMPEFAAAFGCKAGDKMVRPPADRVKIF